MPFSPPKFSGLLVGAVLLSVQCSHHAPITALTPVTTEMVIEKSSLLRTQGLAHYEKGEYLSAIPLLETSLWTDNNRSDTLFILYYCYLSTGEYAKALKTAEELAKNFPFKALTYQQIGLANLWLGNKKAALQNLTRAGEFEIHPPKLHFYIGIASDSIAERDKAFRNAEEEYEEILRKNPKDFTANFELASLYLHWNKSIDRAGTLIAIAKASLVKDTQGEISGEAKLLTRFHFPVLEGIHLLRSNRPESAVKKLLQALSEAPEGSKADVAELFHYVGLGQNAMDNAGAAKMFLEKSLALDAKGPMAQENQRLIREISSENTSL